MAGAGMTGSITKGSRAGYWVIQWSGNWDPNLSDLMTAAPELVIGNHVAITSCDSGLYRPTPEEFACGWRTDGAATVSPKLEHSRDLPTPGFDEWYVFPESPRTSPTSNYVNQFDFSVLGEGETVESFWNQVDRLKPIHVLGCGAPNMFLITRDEHIFGAFGETDFVG